MKSPSDSQIKQAAILFWRKLALNDGADSETVHKSFQHTLEFFEMGLIGKSPQLMMCFGFIMAELDLKEPIEPQRYAELIKQALQEEVKRYGDS